MSEIKELRVAQYDNPKKIDTKGGRIIQGIGMTEWNDGECLFGPSNPYFALAEFDYDHEDDWLGTD